MMRVGHPLTAFGACALATVFVALGLAPGGSALSQDVEDRYDRLWSNAQVFSGADDGFVRSIALSGRFQVDQVEVDSGDASFSDVDLRRLRFGAKFKLAGNVTFHAEGDFDPSGGNLGYRRLTDTYIAWAPSAALALTLGKQGAGFTMDGQTSSKELLTIDRSNLANNMWFPVEYMTGVTAGGEKSGFVYEFGLFSSGEADRGFGDSNGGEFTLTTLGYDFSEALGAREALLRFNYVDNEPDPHNTSTRPLEQVLSANFAFEAERWGLRSDLSSADGYGGQSDLSGVMLMPFVNLSPSLQLVTRYTWLDSDDPNGIRFGLYERAVAAGQGDEYREIYVGVNWFLYGHKLKLQSGLQYADMTDRAMDGGAYTGWSWTTGLRVSW